MLSVELVKVCSPPAVSFGAVCDWQLLAADLGCFIPEAYIEICQVYGAGCFDGFLWGLVPGHGNQNLQLEFQMDRRLKALAQSISDGIYKIDVPIEALLPVGFSDNGDVIYLTESTVEIQGARWGWAAFDMCYDVFLAELLSGSVRVELFPDDFPSGDPVFEPADRSL